MIIGRIIGKVTTRQFSFLIEKSIKKFEFVQVFHPHYDKYVLCQINEIENSSDGTIGNCSIIGYRDKNIIKQIRTPFDLSSEVLLAEEDFIKNVIQSNNDGAYVGLLDGKNIKVFLDLNKLLTKHVSVLAKSGAGKSYTVAVLIEEILEHDIPLIIIDPHGEYSTLKLPNDEQENMAKFQIVPKGYGTKIIEYGNIEYLRDGHPLKVKDSFQPIEIEHILPNKLSQSQLSLLFAAANELNEITISSLSSSLQGEENAMKWSLINSLNYIKSLGYFSETADYSKFIKPGTVSIINMKGIPPEIQDTICYKLLKDLFELRKREEIPPFFTVIEEAHNFCPERSFGEKKSSNIIRTIASEGRKFGMGLCVISQRPARVEKSVLSQMTTQIIMKLTNPNDLKAVLSSVEGISSESYDEIKNLPVGSALIAGVVDIPLIVNIRPRKTKHGGDAIDMLNSKQQSRPKEMLPLIHSNLTEKDYKLMGKEKKTLVPSMVLELDGFSLLLDLTEPSIITNITEHNTAKLPDFSVLSKEEFDHLKSLYRNHSTSEFNGQFNNLMTLINKGFIIRNGSRFKLNPKLIFSKLNNYATEPEVKFTPTEYDYKKEKANEQMIQNLLDTISKYNKILSKKEAWIAHYN